MSKLFAKLALIQSQLKSVSATGHNKFHNYHYATAEDVINAVRPVCSQHGIFISISCTSHEILKDGRAAACTVSLTAFDGESGESTTATMPGYAEDTKSDKSLWKAITGASKYLLKSFFCLASSDDSEKDDELPEHPTPRKATAKTKAKGAVSSRFNGFVPQSSASGETASTSLAAPAALAPHPDTTAIIDQTTAEMTRLGWSNADGRAFLQKNFGGKATRKELTASELQTFLEYLRSLDTLVDC